MLGLELCNKIGTCQSAPDNQVQLFTLGNFQ